MSRKKCLCLAVESAVGSPAFFSLFDFWINGVFDYQATLTPTSESIQDKRREYLYILFALYFSSYSDFLFSMTFYELLRQIVSNKTVK